MSYTILYRVAFLKLSDNTYVPVGESGDNNVWECDNMRRARSWSDGWTMFHHKLSFSEKQITGHVQALINAEVTKHDGSQPSYSDRVCTREDVLKGFSWFSGITIYGKRNITAGEFLGWFRKGIRNARTIEELAALGVTVKVGCWEKSEDGRTEYKKRTVSSEDELRATYDLLTANGQDAYVGYDYVSDYAYSRICSKKVQERKPQDKAYVVHLIERDSYILKKTSRNFHLTSWKEYAHRYCSRPAAERMVAALKRNGYQSDIEELCLKAG